MIISSKVPHVFRSSTLINYLAQRFTYLSKEQWIERILEGRVSCNKRPADAQTVLGADDIVEYSMPDFEEPPADLNYSIVYEDDWLLGINKPPNLLVHHRGKSFRSNLIYQLRYVHTPAYEQAGVINRLDRETSGVVLIAKDKKTLSLFNNLFVARKVAKVYYALVNGIPDPPSGIIDLPVGKQRYSEKQYRFCVQGENAKFALTRYETVQKIGEKYALVRLYPETGRTHQIRVHLSAIGHPVIGDKVYCLNDEEYLAWLKDPEKAQKELLFSRHALHCHQVSFMHPFLCREITVLAPLAEDMKAFINGKKA